jgi:hypothetical protein
VPITPINREGLATFTVMRVKRGPE